ncbi:MAG TPA: wax ester/triacylglycerol synthase family O-acyltransferase [Steroidobacteraceae bacterium]|nr:wax ester/triacylglycerol synthase family O-acyltransferase [Steroidobacteraceae bacterium]
MNTAGHMAALDRAWLLMERPANPMVVVGLVVLQGVLSHARLRRIVQKRFLAFERFRSVPVMDAFSASWAPADYFNIDDHVLVAALPAPAGRRELQELAGELASTPLNPARPRWTFHLVEHYRGGSAVIIRIHHCYADGIALMHVFMRLADAQSGASAESPADDAQSPLAARPAPDGGLGFIPELLGQTLRGSADLIEKSIHYAFHPVEAAGAARGALGIVGEVAHLGMLLPDDPATCLKHTLGGSRRAAWAEPIALEEVRTLSHLLGCSINDVLVATLAGALGRYLDSQGEGTAGLAIRATVPVNLRPEGVVPLELGNHFGLVFVDLPVGIRHPLERLEIVHANMQALKNSPQALVTLGLLTLVGSLPAALEESAIELFSAKASLVASNLRGPQQPLRLGGVQISQLLFWVPQAGSVGTGVSMLTYNGEVQFGVLADRQLIPDPDELVVLIQSEFERLVLLVLLGSSALTV